MRDGAWTKTNDRSDGAKRNAKDSRQGRKGDKLMSGE